MSASERAHLRPGLEPARCTFHPERETLVRCSACGRPICPDCMVYSAVGIKCRDCARFPRSAIVRLKPKRWIKAAAASLGAGTAFGFAYYFILGAAGFFLFFIGAGIGYLVGEAVSRAAGRFRGRETAVIAVAGTVWAFLLPPLLATVAGLGLTPRSLVVGLSASGLINWLVMAVAAFVAWQRTR